LITKITGKLLAVSEEHVTLAIDALEYEVSIPDFARQRLQSQIGKSISLHTIQYFEGNPMQGRMVPRLLGFLSEVEREFFEMLCSVDGLGTKKALRSMVRPVRDVAAAIEEQDAKALAALPGIGPATAERIIAKLRRKVPKFALMVADPDAPGKRAEVKSDVVKETYEVLQTLGHSESDARRLIDAALDKKAKYKDVQELLEAIYQQRQSG
jgi:Holliday junction DNA helicase RuvA